MFLYVVGFILFFCCMWRWAIVKDPDVAKRMVRFMEISTIGVSKEAQLRAITILEMISTNSCPNNFFEFGRFVMTERWKKLREALQGTDVLQVPDFPPQHCNFKQDYNECHPGKERLAIVWLYIRVGDRYCMMLYVLNSLRLDEGPRGSQSRRGNEGGENSSTRRRDFRVPQQLR